MDTIKTNRESLEKLKNVFNETIYKEAIENSASYNTRICLERKLRLPFLDAQTGVAQSDCSLWMHKWQRMPGIKEGQLYSYPSKKWRKKRRQYLMNDRYLTPYAKDSEPIEQDLHAISVMENTTLHQDIEMENGEKLIPEDSKDSWYKDYDETMDIPDIPEHEEAETEGDDYEETYMKKKKKKSKVNAPRSKKKEIPADEKPFACHLCAARYKTRPGLNYHYAHSHNNGTTDVAAGEEEFPAAGTPAPHPPTAGANNDDALAGLKKFQDSFLTFLKTPGNGQKTGPPAPSSVASPAAMSVNSPAAPSTPSTPNPTNGGKSGGGNGAPSMYCDFCLGDNGENKKTLQPEELVTCSDCGRSAHPTCLQFTPNMTASVKKYRWQCIECKSCGLCGTSDNDDQLLFCDDCDRGYHMYCLTPPLSEPPEGSWSCHLCIVEYHGGAKK